jgi:hypothetical protein
VACLALYHERQGLLVDASCSGEEVDGSSCQVDFWLFLSYLHAPCDQVCACETSRMHLSCPTCRGQGGYYRIVPTFPSFGSTRTAYFVALPPSIQNYWQMSSYSCRHQVQNRADPSGWLLALLYSLRACDLSRNCASPPCAVPPAARSPSIPLLLSEI